MRFFQIFFLRIWLDLRALVESHSPNIEKKEFFFADFFQDLGFRIFERKKEDFFEEKKTII